MRSLQLLALMALLATAAKADYSVTPCGGSGQVACSIVQGGGTPAQNADGPNNAAFVQFFETNLPEDDVPPGTIFSWDVTGVSADGYVVGDVEGGAAINTGFVYYNGQVLCCLIDEPFSLDGINNEDMVIGYDPVYQEPFVALASSAEAQDVDEQSLSEIAPSLSDPFDNYFLAIDNQGRILSDNFYTGQEYILDPNPPVFATPEPSSLLLLGIGLILCAVVFRSRMRRPIAKSAMRPAA